MLTNKDLILLLWSFVMLNRGLKTDMILLHWRTLLRIHRISEREDIYIYLKGPHRSRRVWRSHLPTEETWKAGNLLQETGEASNLPQDPRDSFAPPQMSTWGNVQRAAGRARIAPLKFVSWILPTSVTVHFNSSSWSWLPFYYTISSKGDCNTQLFC